MIYITHLALFLLAIGIMTSVSILSIFQIFIFIACCYWIFFNYKTHQLKLPLSAKLLIGFSIICTISFALNIDNMQTPLKNFGKIKYFLFGVGGIFVVKEWLNFANDKMKKNLSSVFLLSFIVSASVAMYQVFVLKQYRARGLTEIMRYGYGSGMILPSVLSLFLFHEKFKTWLFSKYFTLVALGFGVIGMYLTLTRGGLLGFLCAVPLSLYYFKKKIGIMIGSLALAAILFASSFYFLSGHNTGSRFLVSKNINSDKMRRSQWQAAIIATSEKPLLGWGLSNFHSQVKRIKKTYDLDVKSYDNSHAHNLFLEISAGTGIIGLFVFITWLLSWIAELRNSPPYLKAIFYPFILSLVIVGQFEVILDTNNSCMIFGMYFFSQGYLKYIANSGAT